VNRVARPRRSLESISPWRNLTRPLIDRFTQCRQNLKWCKTGLAREDHREGVKADSAQSSRQSASTILTRAIATCMKPTSNFDQNAKTSGSTSRNYSPPDLQLMSGGARNFVDNLREDPTPLPFALILLPESDFFSRFRGGARNYVGHYHRYRILRLRSWDHSLPCSYPSSHIAMTNMCMSHVSNPQSNTDTELQIRDCRHGIADTEHCPRAERGVLLS
jgi:hypothetical protein